MSELGAICNLKVAMCNLDRPNLIEILKQAQNASSIAIAINIRAIFRGNCILMHFQVQAVAI